MEFTHVCIDGDGWYVPSGIKPIGLKTNELVTVIGNAKNTWEEECYLLNNYPDCFAYPVILFRPIDKQFAEDLTALIEQELKEVEPELIPA